MVVYQAENSELLFLQQVISVIGNNYFLFSLLRQITLAHGNSRQIVVEYVNSRAGHKNDVAVVYENFRMVAMYNRLLFHNQLEIISTILKLVKSYLIVKRVEDKQLLAFGFSLGS